MASTKELLKEKINWRIVNLIRDKFTRYEDNNMSCELNINIAGFDAVIYNYSTRKIFEYGMFISIMIYDSENPRKIYTNEMATLQANLEATGKVSHLSKNWINADVYLVNR